MQDIKKLKRLAEEQERINVENTDISFMLEKKSINMEELCRQDMLGKIGFIIDTSINYEDQGTNYRLQETDSIFSMKFGVKENDPTHIKELRYTCDCPEGKNIKKSAGEYCEVCGTYSAEHKYVRGWMPIDKFKVFNPDMLFMFLSNLKSKKSSILDRELKWLVDREFKYNILNLQKKKVLEEFIKEFSEESKFEYFYKQIDTFMTSKIPVVSKSLRHHDVKKKIDGTPDIRSHDLNTPYILISKYVHEINSRANTMSSVKLLNYLSDINREYFKILSIVHEEIGGSKESVYRGKIGGRRLGNSCKLIIESNPTYITFYCKVSYSAFAIGEIDNWYSLFIEKGMTPEVEFRIRQMILSEEDYPIIDAVFEHIQSIGMSWVFGIREPVLYKRSCQMLWIEGLVKEEVIRVNNIALGVGFRGDKDK